MKNMFIIWTLLTFGVGIFLGMVIVALYNGYVWVIIIPTAITVLGWVRVFWAFCSKLEMTHKE